MVGPFLRRHCRLPTCIALAAYEPYSDTDSTVTNVVATISSLEVFVIHFGILKQFLSHIIHKDKHRLDGCSLKQVARDGYLSRDKVISSHIVLTQLRMQGFYLHNYITLFRFFGSLFFGKMRIFFFFFFF